MRTHAPRRFAAGALLSLASIASLASLAPLAACGGGAAGGRPAGTGAAAGPGAAAGAGAAAQPGYCVTADMENVLAAFGADDTTATFCLGKEGDDAGSPTCTAVDLATGAYRAAAAAPVAPDAPPPALDIKQHEKGVEACKDAACRKLDLPKPGIEDGQIFPYKTAVSSDGRRVVAFQGAGADVVFLDAATGKRVKTLKLANDSTCIESAHFVGESVYVETSNCAGPGGSGAVYSWAGKKLADVAPEAFNPFGAEPISVGGDRWALVGFGGGDVLVFDGKTGKQVHLIEIPEPAGCERCGEVLGGGPSHWSATRIAKLSSGKLVTLDGAGVSIIDPAAGKIEKTHRIPICPAKE
jgi:hypothetical protein